MRHVAQSRRVRLLFYGLRRQEDAITSVEEWIAKLKFGSSEHRGALRWKAKLVSELKPGSPRAIESWELARDACDLHDNDWLTCTGLIGESKMAAGDPDHAARIYDELLGLLEQRRDNKKEGHDPWTWAKRGVGFLLLASDAHSQSGNHAASLDRLLQAERELKSELKAIDPRMSRNADSIARRLEEVREKILTEQKNLGG